MLLDRFSRDLYAGLLDSFDRNPLYMLQGMEDAFQDTASRVAQMQLLQLLRQLLQGLEDAGPNAATETSWATLCFLRIIPPACSQLKGMLERASRNGGGAPAAQVGNADLQVSPFICNRNIVSKDRSTVLYYETTYGGNVNI